MPDNNALLAAVANPNVRAFLDMLAAAEGVQHGYNTGFGNTVLPSLQDHPRERKPFTQTDGERNVTTAAGRYQFLEGTWDDVAGKLGLSDFSPASQDLAAVELLRRNGALPAILAGDFETAVAKSGSTWASLPSSPYAQPKRSAEFVERALRGGATTAAPAWLDQVLTEQRQAATPPAATPPLRPGQTARATDPDAVRKLLQVLVPDPEQMTLPGVPDEPQFTPEDDELMQAALATDTRAAREKALAQFTGETYTPEIDLPQSIDDTINRYLALL